MLVVEKLLPVAAWAADTFIGDPRSRLHPVVLIGNMISLIEKKLRRPDDSSSRKRKQWAGLLLVALVLSIVYTATWLIMAVVNSFGAITGFIGGALLLSFTITPRSLAEAGLEIKRLLENGNLEQARYKVGWVVGRDTDTLSVPEITRATVETVAENIVDGIIAPLFFFAVGGVPLAFLYRAVNTLDSMIGYKNDKYRDFGMIAARVDDIFNFIPARITGILLIIAVLTLRYDALRAVRTIWRDASKHPSPNSGIPEAGVAGALGVQLGGLNYYGGVPSDRARMGDRIYELAPGHIAQTIKLMHVVTALFIVIITVITLSEV
jgi:adenosylcobinamide-phosphate synthase